VKNLKPPYDLLTREYFVIIFDPDVDEYTLHLRDGSSFELGTADKAIIYFSLCGNEKFGEECVGRASNFRAVQAIPSQLRVFPINIEYDENDDRIKDLLDKEMEETTNPVVGIF
jgi:hypothetical protein